MIKKILIIALSIGILASAFVGIMYTMNAYGASEAQDALMRLWSIVGILALTAAIIAGITKFKK